LSIKYKDNGTWVEAPNTINVIQLPDSKFTSLINRSITELTASDLEGVNTIGVYSFFSSSLRSVEIPYGIEYINSGAFQNCYNLTSDIIIPDSVKSIGNHAFASCKMSHVIFPNDENNKITKLDDNTFDGCINLESVILPEGITQLGYYVFQRCTSLKTVVFPSTLTSIASQTFSECRAAELYDFTKCTSIPSLGYNAFMGIPTTTKILVPFNLYADWKEASRWSEYAANITTIFEPGVYLDQEIISAPISMSVTTDIITIVTADKTKPNITIPVPEGVTTTLNEVSYDAETGTSEYTVTFDISTMMDTFTATITATTASGESYSTSLEVVPIEIVGTLIPVDGVTYRFELNSDAFYESTNKNVSSSFSFARVQFETNGVKHLYMDCINSGEPSYDYGIISQIDKNLNLNNTAESYGTNETVFKCFRGQSSTNIVTLDFGVPSAGIHTIDIKYLKDGSGNEGNDSLQFRLLLG
jgi:hypothetical protein